MLQAQEEGFRFLNREERTWKRKRIPRRLVAALTLLIGTGLIFGGSELQHKHYMSSLLLQAGLAVLLVLPLLLLERLFEYRVAESEIKTAREVGGVARDIEAVSAQLTETRQSLADLKTETSERLKQAADAQTALIDDARAEPTFSNIRELFQVAEGLRAISEHGLRVTVPGQWERLRFRSLSTAPSAARETAEPVFFLVVEDTAGKSIGVQTARSPGESPSDALVAIAEAWKRVGSYPGDAAINAERIFGGLVKSLGVTIKSRQIGGDNQLSPLIELLSATWAMTDYGLEHAATPYDYTIEATELLADDDLAHWRSHMAEKLWVENEDRCARDIGEPDFWMVSELAQRFFIAHKPTTT